jgi:hypothetical protein
MEAIGWSSPVVSLLFIVAAMVSNNRATPAQLKRAAGSQSLVLLKEALVGYSALEIDSMEGKNPLHMAAWQGCMDSIAYLLEYGCNINAISTGEYSYGKTPIFFALTRSRADVVSFLLDRGANVKIVNNKGQSVLSIAASHLDISLVKKIQDYEERDDGKWMNFRMTHSDGLEYGDLDPRFLDRPLRYTDIVTSICVNPTTKQSRRGAFLKKNPDRVPKPKSNEPPKPKAKSKPCSTLTASDEESLQIAWGSLLDQKAATAEHLLSIVALSAKQKKAWISETAERLRQSMSSTQLETLFDCESVITVSERETQLIQRLYAQVLGTTMAKKELGTSRRDKNSISIKSLSLSINLYEEACLAVPELSIAALEAGSSYILSLPNPPTWVDEVAELKTLANQLEKERLVSFDTEWFERGDSTTKLSTLQLAVGPTAWVVDLTSTDDAYCQACRELISNLFESKIMLGFSIRRDVHKLSDWCNKALPQATCLDLQLLWMKSKSPPGLATCVREFTSKELSKAEQCSDWSRRPITSSQLEYAGLDAAILSYLLVETVKAESITRHSLPIPIG